MSQVAYLVAMFAHEHGLKCATGYLVWHLERLPVAVSAISVHGQSFCDSTGGIGEAVACIGVAFDFSAWGSSMPLRRKNLRGVCGRLALVIGQVPTPQICLELQSSQDCMKISSLPMDNADITAI